MTQPGLELEQRHRLLGVVELRRDRGPGTVAGDLPADVSGGDSGLRAEHRDDGVVDVLLGDAAGPEREQEVGLLGGLAVEHLRLGRADLLPGLDGLAHQRVDGFGERAAGLVGGDVEQADGIAGQDMVVVAADAGAVVLPADAAEAEAGDLVAALAAEQPGERDGADQLKRVGPPVRGQKVLRGEVQAGPEQLGPDVVGDHARVRPEQGLDAARGAERVRGVEPPRDPLPLLAVAEEGPRCPQVAGLCLGRQRLACAVAQPGAPLRVVAGAHPVYRGNPCRARLPGPLGGAGDIRVLGGQPPSGLGQRGAVDAAGLRGDRGGGVPPLDPFGPFLRRALDGGRPGGVFRCGRRRSVPERCQGPVDAVDVFGPVGSHGGVGPELRQRFIRQVFQQRAAVEQQHLADDRGQHRAVAPVAPAGQHVLDLPHGVIDRFPPEDPPGQRLAVEAPDSVESRDAADKAGVSDQVGPCVGADLARVALPQLLVADSDQPGPVLVCPVPVSPLQFAAPHEDHPRRVAGKPPLVASVRMPVQCFPGRVERPEHPADRLPGLRAGIVASAPQQARAQSAQPVKLGCGEFPLPPEAGHVHGPRPGRIRRPCQDDRRRLGGHRASWPAVSMRVRASTRHAWIWSIDLLSLSARSRPDRWI